MGSAITNSLKSNTEDLKSLLKMKTGYVPSGPSTFSILSLDTQFPELFEKQIGTVATWGSKDMAYVLKSLILRTIVTQGVSTYQKLYVLKSGSNDWNETVLEPYVMYEKALSEGDKISFRNDSGNLFRVVYQIELKN